MTTPPRQLLEREAAHDPLEQLRGWLVEADPSGRDDVPMALATATPGGHPSARFVLLRGVGPQGLVFYTSYASRKARELDANPRAAGVLYWPDLDRQVRVEGTVERLPVAESDAYFSARPVGHRISAWASPQSSVVPDRAALERRVERVIERFRHSGDAVPRPPDWGGYRLVPDTYEFWQSRLHRLHDRLRYRRAAGGSWILERLAP